MDCGSVKYQMKESTAKAILKCRKGDDKNMNPKDFLVKYVNEELGLLYHCDDVIVALD